MKPLWNTTLCLFTLILIITGMAQAETVFPQEDWKDQPDPIASPYAYVGGEINIFGGPSPNSLNPYLDNNTFSVALFGLMYESLLTNHSTTLDEQPGLAEKWSISDDKTVFTFWLDPKAKWSDGKPVTAADVKWTFDAVKDPKNLTGVYKASLEKVDSPEILDERTVRFKVHEVHWRNLSTIAGLSIMPKHVFEKEDFNLINFEFPVVSGLYRLEEIKSGISITMERRDNWWNKDAPSAQGVGNFQRIRFKVFEDRETAFEAFLKGDIDLFPVYTSRIWMNETQGEKFDKNWIVKQKVTNHKATGFQGFAMNMRGFPFQDKKTRLAMAHLLNREKMNSTLMYNQYFLHRSYFEHLYDKDHPCPNPLIKFDPEKARALLEKAGWKGNPETGLLEKEGKPFKFKFLTRSASANKFLAIYQQDLKDVGIELSIEPKDYASWAKDMDEFNYQMTWASWATPIRSDPESMWHSKEAERQSGNNITGFKNPRVDEIIEKQKTIFDLQERNKLLREMDPIIYQDYPYALLWNIDFVRLLYWNKFGTPETVLGKYGDERSAYLYWWYDEDAALDLEDARETDRALPRKPLDIQFDETYIPPKE